jgi:hypothetical protein
MIPENITHQNILNAIARVDNEGVPPHRSARDWAVLHNRIHYPCKLLISWANVFANGPELDFKSFISNEARPYLTEREFTVVPI